MGERREALRKQERKGGVNTWGGRRRDGAQLRYPRSKGEKEHRGPCKGQPNGKRGEGVSPYLTQLVQGSSR